MFKGTAFLQSGQASRSLGSGLDAAFDKLRQWVWWWRYAAFDKLRQRPVVEPVETTATTSRNHRYRLLNQFY